MKRFITILSIFLFISFSLNAVNVFAQTNPRTLTQGIYNARDAKLLIGAPVTARMKSPTDRAVIIVINSDQTIRALVRLTPQITQQILPPLDYDNSVIIFTNGSVVLS